MLPPAQILPFAATAADVQLATGAFILRGWSFIETTGAAAAAVNLIDGSSSAGPLIVPIALSSGESTRDPVPGAGLQVRTGLFLDVTAGTVAGSLWVIPIAHWSDFETALGEWADVWVRAGL